MALTSLPLVFLLLTVAGAAPPGCPPATCGDEFNDAVTYPFWIPGGGINSSYCGYPDLDLECVDGVLTMKTLEENYAVIGINSSTRTIRLVSVDFLDSDCPRPRHNLTLDQILPLAYTPNDANLTFRFNCSDRAGPEANRIGCLDGLRSSYVGWEGGVAECEEAVAVPVMRWLAEVWKWKGNMSLGFAEVVKSGFELKWETSGWEACRECEESGGFCGYENRVDKGFVTVCYCDDGTHNLHCHGRGKKLNAWKKIIIVTSLTVGVMIFLSFTCIIWKNKRNNRDIDSVQRLGIHNPSYKKNKSVDLDSLVRTEFYLMDIKTAKAVTNHFADTNKLGQGGFGSVYKGVLADGNEIAIKRLSSNSTQGAEEFKNEVKLISQLQHKNLVKLLGCCVEGGEKLIIYQYLPNGSLDTVLVDPNKRSELDWETRKHIVFGITRGLTYLHEDSQLKVVHRDLKPSNILLDLSMNAKISDFGLARIFDNDTNEVNTNRLVGTFGYMAPEFAMAGLFSVKSDVFGFGVLLLEIISGQRNGRLHFEQYEQSLLTRAWNLWKEKEGADLVNELVDPSILGKFPTSEAIRWIQIALLCVQENASDRPTMSAVLRMFETEQMKLMEPQQPPYFTCHGELPPLICFPDMPVCTSTNMVTMTEVEVR